MADDSTAPPDADKVVIVRVKRKVSQSPLDGFWLEINERPLKKALHNLGNLSISNASSSKGLEIQETQQLLDFEKLSLSDASSSRVKELRKEKILLRHVKTVASSKDTFDVLRSVVPTSSVELKSEERNEARRQSLKTVNKQDPLHVKARQRQEISSRHARFEQIWRSRKEIQGGPEGEAIYNMCKLYDIVRVDVEEEHVVEVQNKKVADLADCKMMDDYLPLLRDILPIAAEEIESDIKDFMVKQASPDGYVYDVYAVNKDGYEMDADATSLFPLLQVDDDDEFYDGPDDSEYESDDSNAENNPMNDYPEEEMSEDGDGDEDEDEDEDEDGDEDDDTSISSDEELEEESDDEDGSGSQVSLQYEEGFEEYGSQLSLQYEEGFEEYALSDDGDHSIEEGDDNIIWLD